MKKQDVSLKIPMKTKEGIQVTIRMEKEDVMRARQLQIDIQTLCRLALKDALLAFKGDKK